MCYYVQSDTIDCPGLDDGAAILFRGAVGREAGCADACPPGGRAAHPRLRPFDGECPIGPSGCGVQRAKAKEKGMALNSCSAPGTVLALVSAAAHAADLGGAVKAVAVLRTSAGPTSPPPRPRPRWVLRRPWGLPALGHDPLSVPVTFHRHEEQATSTSSWATGCRRWRPTSNPTRPTAVGRGGRPTCRAPSSRWRCRPTSPRPALKDFADIAKFTDQLDGKIYGIEPGNDGNQNDPRHDRGQGRSASTASSSSEFSEQGMLAQVERAGRKKPIVFLGWEPHPMNTKFELDLPDRRRRLSSARTSAAPTIYTRARKG